MRYLIIEDEPLAQEELKRMLKILDDEFTLLASIDSVKESIEWLRKNEQPDIIFIEGQSSLTEKGNPHPRGLSAAILIGAAPDAVIVGHRPNHPYREPRGIEEEIKAIESIEPTKVVGISINLKNAELDMDVDFFESKYDLPVEDVYNNGASKLLDAILDYLEE